MSLIEITNISNPIDQCYADNSTVVNTFTSLGNSILNNVTINGVSDGYLKTNSNNVQSVTSIPISDISGASIVTNPLISDLDCNNKNITNVDNISCVSVTLNSQDLNTRLTSDESQISTNSGNISTLQGQVATNTSDISSLQSNKVDKTGSTLTGTLITQTIYPSTGGLYDCGTNLNQWANVNTQQLYTNALQPYSGTTISLYGNIDATSANSQTIGSTSNYLNTIYTNNIVPGQNLVGNIGGIGPNRFYNNIYCNNYNANGPMTLSTTRVIPYADNAVTLGDSLTNRKYQNVYTYALELNGTDLNTRLTTDETNIAQNTSDITTKFTKSGDTFTGPVTFGLSSSVDFNGQTLQNVYNITHQGPGRVTLFDAGFIPNGNGLKSLGEPSNKWGNVYATDFNLNGTSVNTSLSSKLNTTAQTSLDMNNNNITNVNSLTSASIINTSQSYAALLWNNASQLFNINVVTPWVFTTINIPYYNLVNFTSNGTGLLTYTGSVSKRFMISATASVFATANNISFALSYYINGALPSVFVMRARTYLPSANNPISQSFTDMIQLNPGDTVQLTGTCNNSTQTISAVYMNINLLSID